MTRILVTEKLAAQGLIRMRQATDVDIELDLSSDQLKAILPRYDALVVRSQTQVTADVLAAGTNLRVVGRAGTGVDNIDQKAATAHGILVVNAPDANSIAAAELTMGLMLALARRIPQGHVSLTGGKWERGKFMGNELRGKTLGLLGVGRIGGAVARRAQAFDMTVLAYDPYTSVERAEQLGVHLVTLDDLLRQADVVSLHVPKTDATRNLLNAERLAQMKRGAWVINAARGGIIDETALAEALQEGQIGGAGLDVWATEPPSFDTPLLRLPNVVALPHLGASTEEAQVRAAVDVAEGVVDALQNRTPRYAVNAPFVAPEEWSVVGPFVALSTILAKLSMQLVLDPVRSYEIVYAGDLTQSPTEPIRLSILAGLLTGSTEGRVTPVNAGLLAQERGIIVSERKERDAGQYAALLELNVTTDDGTIHCFGGTSVHGEPHIVQVEGFRLDLVPSQSMLFTVHQDQPGLIGRVGTLLGQRDVNISSMHVGRLAPRGQAMMVLTVDEPVPDAALVEIEAQMGIDKAYSVRLGDRG